ncbi:MAG: alcohol dehydrogenase catalytic domain-containing protein [Pseudomonadota bacterium]
MLALQKTNPTPGIALQDVAEPTVLEADEVLLRIEAAGICGTDIHIAAWTPGYEAMAAVMPITLGHEACGIVEQVGPNVDAANIGQRVTIRPSVVCHRCTACLAGDTDHCSNRRGVGVTRDGAFAAKTVVPFENCVPVPDGLAADIAALCEPMTVCKEAVDTAGIVAGDKVLVLGPGSIGQGIALFAEAAGASTVVICGYDDEARLSVAQKLGFHNTVDSQGVGLQKAVAPWLDGDKFDVVIEATGVPSIVNDALGVLKKRGVLVVAGIHPAPASVDLTAMVRNHQQIRGTYRAPEATWPVVLDFLHANQDRVRHMITHRVVASEAAQGLQLSASKVASKVMVFQGG